MKSCYCTILRVPGHAATLLDRLAPPVLMHVEHCSNIRVLTCMLWAERHAAQYLGRMPVEVLHSEVLFPVAAGPGNCWNYIHLLPDQHAR